VTVTGSNCASTVELAASVVGVQGVVPAHAPDQPPKKDPVAAVAFNETREPNRNRAVHAAPHLMPTGSLVTAPDPRPLFVTASRKLARSKTAVAVAAAASVSEHAPLPEQAPVQDEKTDPGAACGVSVTMVPQS
jgi:hypothetical protein